MKALDLLASGIHDAKNQLFSAESLIAAAETAHGIDLGEARFAIQAAARRLNQTLACYRQLRHETRIALIPTVIDELCEEVALDQRHHLTAHNITLDLDCHAPDAWPLDRELVTDMLNNAVQNAARHARSRVRLSTGEDAEGLWLRVEDDGPGYPQIPPSSGTGLLLAASLAEMHVRQGRHGSLTLTNDSALGGARFTLRLP